MHTETLPLYRHKELYEWNEKYQEYKFFTEEDYAQEFRLKELRHQGVEDYDYSHGELPYEWAKSDTWNYKNRYGALKQSGVFFDNLNLLDEMRYNAVSYSEYILKAEIRGIDKKYADFVLLYTWFGRRRVFPYDYWEKGKNVSPDMTGWNKWLLFREMCKEAFKDGHKCCTYTEFIAKPFK